MSKIYGFWDRRVRQVPEKTFAKNAIAKSSSAYRKVIDSSGSIYDSNAIVDQVRLKGVVDGRSSIDHGNTTIVYRPWTMDPLHVDGENAKHGTQWGLPFTFCI